MPTDTTRPNAPESAAMRELDRGEALELLGQVPVGRVVYSHEALPAARPVNFVLVGSDVAFRVSGDSELAEAVDGNVVAFEADHIDVHRRIGWSVVVTGLAELLESGPAYERIVAEAPEPWAPGEYDRVVRIRTELVAGRRITRTA
ncbi:pyridoxamine 5'-phosphate oxidase family protein [Yinghuangia seranimata]|uniref:pyridoxamine 5'-phosphate oxidase family protein n=1 Tax=Yinghuangia seranimata TaxID=408067 RepID=UPI00248B1C12|nr:pyridoxamine 5'-phosphate oxidase family protein [Yinghuangia seranimata]MDI2125440.1 pyridoxamine 5'-phosphate oxidase family protein [Yinghuangia seranimata]